MALIGQLRHRAKLQKVIKQDNGRGGWIETKKEIGEIWVAQYGITERLRVEFRKAGLEAETKFIVRNNHEIDKETKIIFNGKTFNVELIERPLETNGYMGIFCTEGEK